MLGFGDDLAGLEPLEPRSLAAGEFDLSLREIGGRGILNELLVDLLDGKSRLGELLLEPGHVEFIVAWVDLEEHGALGHQLALVARGGLLEHAARHLRGQRDLSKRHDHAVDLEIDARRLRLDRPRLHHHGLRRLLVLPRWRLRPTEHHEPADRGPEDHERKHPTEECLEDLHRGDSRAETVPTPGRANGSATPIAASVNRVTWSAMACGVW